MPKMSAKQREANWALDRTGVKIQIGAVVKAPRSMHKTAPIKCMVKYCYNGYLFLTALEFLVGDKAHMVAKSDRCEFVYINESKVQSKDVDEDKIFLPRDPLGVPLKDDYEPAIVRAMRASEIVYASQINWLAEDKRVAMKNDPRSASSDMFQKGASVRIFGGAYKGLRGEVREWLGQTVRISLLPKPKLVDVSVAYVGPDILYDSPKVLRFPNIAAPPTPKEALVESPMPASPSPEISQFAGSNEVIDDWDPNYGIDDGPRDPAMNTEVPLPGDAEDARSEGAQTISTTSSPRYGRRDRSPPSASQSTPKRRRRQAKFPGVDASPNSSSSKTGGAMGDSPGRDPVRRSNPPPPWAVPGAVVEHVKDGKVCKSVVKKGVSPTLITAFPFGTLVEKWLESKSTVLKVEEDKMKPVPCEVDKWAYIFAGRFQGKLGKVTEIDIDDVLIAVAEDDGLEILGGEIEAQVVDVVLLEQPWYKRFALGRRDGGRTPQTTPRGDESPAHSVKSFGSNSTPKASPVPERPERQQPDYDPFEESEMANLLERHEVRTPTRPADEPTSPAIAPTSPQDLVATPTETRVPSSSLESKVKIGGAGTPRTPGEATPTTPGLSVKPVKREDDKQDEDFEALIAAQVAADLQSKPGDVTPTVPPVSSQGIKVTKAEEVEKDPFDAFGEEEDEFDALAAASQGQDDFDALAAASQEAAGPRVEVDEDAIREVEAFNAATNVEAKDPKDETSQ